VAEVSAPLLDHREEYCLRPQLEDGERHQSVFLARETMTNGCIQKMSARMHAVRVDRFACRSTGTATDS
jgi:hypothetical protein